MQDVETVAPAGKVVKEGFWPKGWWSIVDFKIGIIRVLRARVRSLFD